MYKPVQTCTQCGANLTLDDMRRTDCPYCRTVYPHHSMAAQHAQMVGQVFANMNAPQVPGGPPPVGPVPPIQPGAPSPYGASPYGASPYGASPFGGVDPYQLGQQNMRRAERMTRRIGLVVLGSFVVVALLIAAIVALSMFV